MQHKKGDKIKLATIIYIVLLFNIFNIKSVDWLITTSGNYKLGYDINSTGDANGTIRIQSSYVNLDLNGFFLRQTTSTSGCIGIVIDPACNNINIKNGIITDFKTTGISVGANCSKITIKDMLVQFCTESGASGAGIAVGAGCNNLLLDNILTVSCTVDGIDFNGLSNNNIVDSIIRNCCVIGCSTDAANGILLSNCARIKVINSILNSNGNGTNSLNLIRINSSSGCSFDNINIKNSAATIFTGINATNSNQLIFNNCLITRFSYTGSSCNGISLSSCDNSFLEQINILNSTSAADVAFFNGISLSACNSIKVSNFNFWGHTQTGEGTTLVGLGFNGGTTEAVCESITILNNAGFDVVAININGSSNNKISNFVMSGLTATSVFFPIAMGSFLFDSNNNFISNGAINGCTASVFLGITLSVECVGNNFSDIIMQGNTGVDVFYGFNFDTVTDVNTNYLFRCKVVNNSSSANSNPSCVGFYAPLSINNQFISCVAANNTNSANTSQGLYIASNVSSQGNVVRDCEFYGNNGNTAANSYGIRCFNSSAALFNNNSAYKNGATNPLIANQLFGLAIGSKTTPGGGGSGTASSRISSAVSPWTNLQVTN